MDLDQLFQTVRSLSNQLQSYDSEEIEMWDLAHLLRSSADVTNLSVSFYGQYPDANDYYKYWLDAMNRNMGDPNPETPFNGCIKDATPKFLHQLEKAVQEFIDDPKARYSKGVNVAILLKAPIKVYQAVDACEWVSLNMETAGVPSELIPDRVPMEQALALEQLYFRTYREIANILAEMPKDLYAWVKGVYEDDGKKAIPFVEFKWYVPEQSPIKMLRKKML